MTHKVRAPRERQLFGGQFSAATDCYWPVAACDVPVDQSGVDSGAGLLRDRLASVVLRPAQRWIYQGYSASAVARNQAVTLQEPSGLLNCGELRIRGWCSADGVPIGGHHQGSCEGSTLPLNGAPVVPRGDDALVFRQIDIGKIVGIGCG
jgi:hypothetical protein